MTRTMTNRFSDLFLAVMAKLTSKYSIYLILLVMLVIWPSWARSFMSA